MAKAFIFLKERGGRDLGQGAVWGLRREHGRYVHWDRIVRGAFHAREVRLTMLCGSV